MSDITDWSKAEVEEVKDWRSKVEKIKLEDIKLHAMVNKHPLMTNKEFTALKLSIDDIGQMEPVIVYRKKIVDGRHRYNALLDLGISKIKFVSIPNNWTLHEVEGQVIATENRRHQTATQRGIAAYRAYITQTKENKIGKAAMCDKYAINKDAIGYCQKIVAGKGSMLLDALFKGGQVILNDGTRSRNLKLVADDVRSQIDAEIDMMLGNVRISDTELQEKMKPYIASLKTADKRVIKEVNKLTFKLLREMD